MTKFGMVAQVGKLVSRSATATPPPPSKGRSLCVPKISGTSYMRAYSMRNANQIMHGDHTTCDEYFYKVDHEF